MSPDVVSMICELSECLDQWSTLLPKPRHKEFVDGWKDTMKDYIHTVYPIEDTVVESVTAGLLEAFGEWSSASVTDEWEEPVDHEKTHSLMKRPQTTQRTANWYEEFQTRLTASEISKVFGSPRDRGTLVMMKAGKLEIPGRSAVQVSIKEKMSPFDWGICFEPVIKLILESEWDAMIHECGRFVHPTDTRLAASPDGLILRSKVHPGMGGHLLEIKCPKSRKIGLKIPSEYYYQMQLQLEVTGVRACEYVEAKFEFTDAQEVPAEGWIGKLAIIGCFCEQTSTWTPCKYVYGPVGDLAWTPDLGLNEQTLQLNTWICSAFHHERVLRDEGWFNALWPKLESFWLDVEKAKKGEFQLPESSRKKKDVVCEIVDSEPESDAQKVKPEAIDQQAKPEAIDQQVKPEAIDQQVKPQAIDPDVKIVTIK